MPINIYKEKQETEYMRDIFYRKKIECTQFCVMIYLCTVVWTIIMGLIGALGTLCDLPWKYVLSFIPLC